MMGWMTRSSSTPAVGFVDKKRVEPGAAFSAVENHWKQAKTVMDNPNAQTASDALTVISHLNQMVNFLKLTRNDGPEHKNCKKFWIANRCSDIVLQWLHSLQIKGTRLEYEDEKKLVQTLEALCELASIDGEILGYGGYSSSGSSSMGGNGDDNPDAVWDGACSLSSLLLEYSLKGDPYLGEPARNSFVILIQLSAKFPELENCFLKDTSLELMNVVISGLSACFAQLPTFYSGTDEQIEPFRTQLKFVDRVAHAAPSTISLTIADCFSNTFLYAVILPALTQSLHEEIAIVTSYLKIVGEHLTHPQLVKSLMTFILNNLTMPILLERMNHQNVSVTVATLSLLSTLLTFYCEDLWYELILRHLMSQRHLMVSQRTIRLPPIDYQEASLRFLSLIPSPIVEVMGPEAINYHYSQYLDNEMSRLPIFLNQEFSFSEKSTNTRTQPSIFSMWSNKYDGTDEILPPLKLPISSSSYNQDPSLNIHPLHDNILESQNTQSFNNRGVGDPLTTKEVSSEHCEPNNTNDQEGGGLGSDPFTTISLQPRTDEPTSLGADSNANSEDLSINPSVTNERGLFGSDGYGSLEYEFNGSSSSSDAASLGPFLDIMLNHLKNLSRLHPDMILMVTEIMSILARSRVPLLTSILLDTRIILQPSYVSFSLLLNRIRVEFEQALRSNCSILKDVWTTYNKEIAELQLQDPTYHNSSISSSTSMNFIHSLSTSFDSSFGDKSFTESIKKKIHSSSLLNNVFQRKPSTGSLSRNSMPTSSPGSVGGSSLNGSELNDNFKSPTNLQSYRHRTGQNISPESPLVQQQKINQSTESLKIMATRAIYFAHWLLELSTISQEFCWKKPYIGFKH
ncbi:UPF0518 protein GK23746 isoform X2 [Folsomia candida]|uniref:UPF0518 protein GK23746 isoform X2 n=1 Tax=Folsomia candida TaxID=158441 RepID=UPI000B8FBC04|nr:UPF0518 protein GK23746 isoform X2 [Folsomia candida]